MGKEIQLIRQFKIKMLFLVMFLNYIFILYPLCGDAGVAKRDRLKAFEC